MSDWYDEWKAKAQAYRPVKDIDQNVLWLKQMGIMSEHFKEMCNPTDAKYNITETFLNQMMQLAYNQGHKTVDERSFEKGRQSMWDEIMNKLGVEEKDYE